MKTIIFSVIKSSEQSETPEAGDMGRFNSYLDAIMVVLLLLLTLTVDKTTVAGSCFFFTLLLKMVLSQREGLIVLKPVLIPSSLHFDV